LITGGNGLETILMNKAKAKITTGKTLLSIGIGREGKTSKKTRQLLGALLNKKNESETESSIAMKLTGSTSLAEERERKAKRTATTKYTIGIFF